MIFHDTPIAGAWLIEADRAMDDRGAFETHWNARDFEARGLSCGFDQLSVARNRSRGTLRGLHFQAPPYEQAKLVRCVAGRVFDVIVDLRPDSLSHLQQFCVELDGSAAVSLWIPRGCAHGYQTLTAEADVQYLIAGDYVPAAQSGVRYDDPSLAIVWPLSVAALSERDARLPLLRDHVQLLGAMS